MLVGHQKQVKFLSYMAQAGLLPHALLFSGPEHLGKRTLAIELAKIVNCKSANLHRQECSLCRAVENNLHPDLLLIEPKENSLKIAQIREIGNFLSLRPAFGRLKIVIVDNAHLLTVSAQQAFLKALEEPRGKSLIILVTSKPNLLLATVLSRVWHTKFFPPTTQEFKSFLQKQDVRGDAENIIKLSGRRPGVALELLRNRKKIEGQERALKGIRDLCRSGLPQRFRWAQNTSKDRQNTSEILELWLRFFRGLLIMKLSPGPNRVRVLPDYSLSRLLNIMGTLQEVDFAVSNSNVNTRMALDVLMTEL